MTKIVFSIRKDDDYQYLLPVSSEVRKTMMNGCVSGKDNWVPIDLEPEMDGAKQGNFYQFDEGYLLADQKAVDAVGDFFQSAGEVLPVNYKETRLWFVNILNCVDCFDKDETIWDPNFAFPIIKQPAFRVSKLRIPGLFKIPELATTDIYVLVDTDLHEETNFKRQVEKHGLQGIWFEQVWTSE